MQKHKFGRGVAKAAAVGAAALSASLILGVGAGVASAAPADPPGGATPVAPHFYNGNVEGIRNSGSDTTFFMMQKVGDLFTGAGLYGCTLNTSPGQTLYNSSDPASATTNESYFCQSGQNVSTTDTSDNWDRTEVTEGVDSVGSGAGQNQLCAAASTPLPVDFARSSKPSTGACSTEVQTGYAKDGVPIIAYPPNPAAIGTSSTAPYSGINGGVVGPVALGWLPGDPGAGPYTGSALTNISNVDNGGGANSTAYRMWCQTGAQQITDWGSLTNLGPNIVVPSASVSSGSAIVTLASAPFGSIASGQTITGADIPSGTTISAVGPGNQLTMSNNATGNSSNENPKVNIGTTLAVGQGAPIGVPLRIMGLNTASGTEATFASYAESGVASGGCSSNMNTDAALDPNPATKTGTNATAHIALENNSDQIDQFAAGDFPSPDYVDQAIEVATTLYIESNGVYNTNPYAAASTINGVKYTGIKVGENGKTTTTANILSNNYPTARTLFNIYNSNTVRGSTGGFLNWICDANTNFSKGLDNSTGVNFDQELTNTIGTTFGFPRLTDESAAPAIATPADNIAAPNNSCAATLGVNTTSGSDQITLASGNFPPDIVNAGGLVGGASVGVSSANFPAGTTVVSGAGTSTLTLSQNATASGTNVATVFAGVPSVTAVANPQT
jgi:hypothetical protein